MKKAIVLFGAHRWNDDMAILEAKASGFAVVLGLIGPEEPHLSETAISALDGIIRLDKSLEEQHLQTWAERLHKKYPAGWYTIAVTDFDLVPAAKLGALSTMPFFPEVAAEIAFYKHKTREHWNELARGEPQLGVVGYSLLDYHTLDATSDFYMKSSPGFQELSGPFIVRPDAYGGSVGVVEAATREELPEALKTVRDVLRDEQAKPLMAGIDIEPGILIEAMVEHPNSEYGLAEYTAHFCSLKGAHALLGVTQKVIDEETFIETAHFFPAPDLDPEAEETAINAFTRMLDRLSVQNGLSNFEFIVDPSGIISLIEMHLRPTENSVIQLLQRLQGESMWHYFLKGLEASSMPELNVAEGQAAHVWLAPGETLSQIQQVIANDSATKENLSVRLSPSLSTAKNWAGPYSWYHRFATIHGTGENLSLLLQDMQKVAQNIRLQGLDFDNNETTTHLKLPFN